LGDTRGRLLQSFPVRIVSGPQQKRTHGGLGFLTARPVGGRLVEIGRLVDGLYTLFWAGRKVLDDRIHRKASPVVPVAQGRVERFTAFRAFTGNCSSVPPESSMRTGRSWVLLLALGRTPSLYSSRKARMKGI